MALPKDERALQAAVAFMDDLVEAPPLKALARQAGASVRTIERIFRAEVGTSFESWRRQVRLVKAIGLLAGGRSVKEAAHQVGYRQPSAFVEMFRKTIGTTPAVWAREFRMASGMAEKEASGNRPVRWRT